MIPILNKEIIDLSIEIKEGMSVYPGDPKPKFNHALTVDKHNYNVHEITIGTHTGTHIDAPRHWFDEGKTIDMFELSQLVFPAVVIDMSHKKEGERIVKDDILRYADKIKPSSIVLIHTGWRKYFGTEHFENHPFLDESAVKWLVEKKIAAVGIDTLNVDQTFNNKSWAAHDNFLYNDILIIEVLTNLEKILTKNPLVFICPLKLVGMDGAPARVFAVI